MGGHCLPVDPFYLAFKAREYDFPAEFVELAGKVNQHQPHYCVERVVRALNERSASRCATRGCCCSASPTRTASATCARRRRCKIAHLLRELGAEVAYHDPHVPEVAELGLALGRPSTRSSAGATSPA